MKLHNPNCDGDRCHSSTGEVRRLPDGGEGGGAVILCHACYQHEIAWRQVRNVDLDPHNHFPLPKWEDLDVYEG